MKLIDIFESDDERMERAQRMGYTRRLYHKTDQDFTEFKPFSHFGTQAQANMRGVSGASRVIPVLVKGDRFKRLKDTNSSWNLQKLKMLARQGYDGVVYLNRVEGIPKAEFDNVRLLSGKDPLTTSLDELINKLSDTQFKKLCPSAEDSYIVFDPMNVRSVHANFEKYYDANMLA